MSGEYTPSNSFGEQLACPQRFDCAAEGCAGPKRGELLTPGAIIGGGVFSFDSAGNGVLCGKEELPPGMMFVSEDDSSQ